MRPRRICLALVAAVLLPLSAARAQHYYPTTSWRQDDAAKEAEESAAPQLIPDAPGQPAEVDEQEPAALEHQTQDEPGEAEASETIPRSEAARALGDLSQTGRPAPAGVFDPSVREYPAGLIYTLCPTAYRVPWQNRLRARPIYFRCCPYISHYFPAGGKSRSHHHHHHH